MKKKAGIFVLVSGIIAILAAVIYKKTTKHYIVQTIYH